MYFFDGHCDTILHCYLTGEHLADSTGHWNLDKIKDFAGVAQFFACFGEPEDTPGIPLWEVFQQEVSLFCRELAANSERITLCTTAADLETAWRDGKAAAFLSAEGAELLDCDPGKLEMAYRWGLRAVNLTWNHENALSGTNVESPERGLTQQGAAFVRQMQELGMLVDVSHLSDPGFWDVVELAQKPIFASHSDSRACHPHTRNLTDEQFTAIIKLRGTVGLNLCPEFLGEPCTLDTMRRHLDHFLELGGEDTVALGGDWDGISRLPYGIRDVTGWAAFYEHLKAHGYSDTLLDKLFYKNLMRVVREVCTM